MPWSGYNCDHRDRLHISMHGCKRHTLLTHTNPTIRTALPGWPDRERKFTVKHAPSPNAYATTLLKKYDLPPPSTAPPGGAPPPAVAGSKVILAVESSDEDALDSGAPRKESSHSATGFFEDTSFARARAAAASACRALSSCWSKDLGAGSRYEYFVTTNETSSVSSQNLRGTVLVVLYNAQEGENDRTGTRFQG